MDQEGPMPMDQDNLQEEVDTVEGMARPEEARLDAGQAKNLWVHVKA